MKDLSPPPISEHLVSGPKQMLSWEGRVHNFDAVWCEKRGCKPVESPAEVSALASLPDTEGVELAPCFQDAANGFKPRIPGLPTDSAARKEFPMGTGCVDYFAAALAEVSHVSWCGNQKHNPGQPMHHARGKSMDHPDCIVRHFSERGGWDRFEWTDAAGVKQVRWVLHSAYTAWRALADLQQECEDLGAPRARAAR